MDRQSVRLQDGGTVSTTKSKRKTGPTNSHDEQKVKKTTRKEDWEEESEGEEPQLNEISSRDEFYASSIEMRQAYFENDAEFILLRDKLLGIAPGQVLSCMKASNIVAFF